MEDLIFLIKKLSNKINKFVGGKSEEATKSIKTLIFRL